MSDETRNLLVGLAALVVLSALVLVLVFALWTVVVALKAPYLEKCFKLAIVFVVGGAYFYIYSVYTQEKPPSDKG